MSTKKGVKKELRKPKPKSVDEWIEKGDVSPTEEAGTKKIKVDKTYADNTVLTTTVPFDIVDQFDEFTRKHRRKTGQVVGRASVLRVWMYAFAHAPQKFRDEFLNAADDEDEMLAILLERLKAK